MPALEPIYQQISALWLDKITAANEARSEFDKIGEMLMKLYTDTGPEVLRDDLAAELGIEIDLNESRFPLKADKVSEMIDLLAPAMYSTNPVRTLSPRQLWRSGGGSWIDEQERARRDGIRELVEAVLNYTPSETGLKAESRKAIVEAFIRGRGCMWLSTVRRADGTSIVTSRYETVKRLGIDPDADSLRSAWWISRLRVEPEWRVRRQFRIPESVDLKPGGSSLTGKSRLFSDTKAWGTPRKYTKDVVAYYEVWSKMGIGGRFRDSPRSIKNFEEELQGYAEKTGTSADNVWLCIPLKGGVPRPLNMGYDQDRDEGMRRIQWPVELWQDDRWPVQCLDLHDSGVTRESGLWPRSHLHSVLAELFLASFLLSRIAHKVWFSTRELIAVAQSLHEELKEVIKSGGDLTVIPVPTDQMARLDSLIGHIPSSGQMPIDIAAVKQLIEGEIEKRTGVSEMRAGVRDRQMKTVAEAQLFSGLMQVRPDDLADRGEDWATEVARNEYHALRRLLVGSDVVGLLGQEAAAFWEAHIKTSSVSQSAAEFECRIEAGSARKPNKQRDIENAEALMQFGLAPAMQYGTQIGDMTTANWIMEQQAKTKDMERPPGGVFFTIPPQMQQQMAAQQQPQMPGGNGQMPVAEQAPVQEEPDAGAMMARMLAQGGVSMENLG